MFEADDHYKLHKKNCMLGTTISISAAEGMHKEPSRSVYETIFYN